MCPRVSHLASLNHLAQVSLVGLGVRDLGLIPVHALQVLSLGSPVNFLGLRTPIHTACAAYHWGTLELDRESG